MSSAFVRSLERPLPFGSRSHREKEYLKILPDWDWAQRGTFRKGISGAHSPTLLDN